MAPNRVKATPTRSKSYKGVDVFGSCPPVTVVVTTGGVTTGGVTTGGVTTGGVITGGVTTGGVTTGGVITGGVTTSGVTTTVTDEISVAVISFALPLAVAVLVVDSLRCVSPV